jgi:hypothetical protein
MNETGRFLIPQFCWTYQVIFKLQNIIQVGSTDIFRWLVVIIQTDKFYFYVLYISGRNKDWTHNHSITTLCTKATVLVCSPYKIEKN